MVNTSDSSERDSGGRVWLPEVMTTGHATGSDASSPALTAVIVCMAIMAICAVFYFAIRYYFEERRWRAGAVLCKCLPPGTVATLSTIECANACRYSEKRAATVGVQTIESICWPSADVRMSDARLAGRKFASPANNNEAIPHWRPPATGSSNRNAGTSTGAPYRTSQKKQRYFVHHSTQYPSELSYPLRRSRNISMMPSILVQSASSSDSYSHLTSSHLSKQAPSIKDKVHPLHYTESDDETDCRTPDLAHRQDGSGLTDPLLYGTSPFHPRNNTPVSALTGHDPDDELAAALANVEQRRGGREDSSPSSGHGPLDEAGYDEDASSEAESAGPPSRMPAATADGATQICPTIDYTLPLRAGRVPSSCSADAGSGRSASAGVAVSAGAGEAAGSPLLDTMRLTSRLPPRNAFPSFELLPGGRLVTRWTQTDNASVMSLDWDHYDERWHRGVEVGVDAVDTDAVTDPGADRLPPASNGADSADRLTLLDEENDTATGMSSATLLMVSHTSGETSHHPARHNSTRRSSSSSPYVLCYVCSEGYGMTDDRRRSVTNVTGVTTVDVGRSLDFDSRRPSPPPPPPTGHQRPPSAPVPSLGPTPPERQRRSHRTAPRPSRT